MSERRPPWDNLAPALAMINREVRESGPSGRALVDQLGAYVRNTLDSLSVEVTDEHSVYVAITIAAFFVQMARNGVTNKVVEPLTLNAIAHIAHAFTAALIDYVPAEVRP